MCRTQPDITLATYTHDRVNITVYRSLKLLNHTLPALLHVVESDHRYKIELVA